MVSVISLLIVIAIAFVILAAIAGIVVAIILICKSQSRKTAQMPPNYYTPPQMNYTPYSYSNTNSSSNHNNQ